MQYQITYSKAKNGWVKLLPDMTLKIIIPHRKSSDKSFEKLLIEKGMEMIQKYKKKNIIKIQWFWEDFIMIFWEKVLLNTIYWDINIYIKQRLFIEAKLILDEVSIKIWINYKNLYIKSLKTKWGSCSWINNISINLEFIHLDKKFLNYVVIHEACHLKEKNHWKNFWDLVWKYCPNYKEIRKELKLIRL